MSMRDSHDLKRRFLIGAITMLLSLATANGAPCAMQLSPVSILITLWSIFQQKPRLEASFYDADNLKRLFCTTEVMVYKEETPRSYIVAQLIYSEAFRPGIGTKPLDLTFDEFRIYSEFADNVKCQKDGALLILGPNCNCLDLHVLQTIFSNGLSHEVDLAPQPNRQYKTPSDINGNTTWKSRLTDGDYLVEVGIELNEAGRASNISIVRSHQCG